MGAIGTRMPCHKPRSTPPCGIFRFSTMMVMMMAITPSENASMRPVPGWLCSEPTDVSVFLPARLGITGQLGERHPTRALRGPRCRRHLRGIDRKLQRKMGEDVGDAAGTLLPFG